MKKKQAAKSKSSSKKMSYSKDMEVYGPKNVVKTPKINKPNHGINKR